jgi:hypothetical protein
MSEERVVYGEVIEQQLDNAVAAIPDGDERSMDIGSPYGSLRSFELAQRMAKALSCSDLVPTTYRGNVANTLVALELAHRTRLSPFMVMQNLYIMNGRPSWSAQFLIALVNTSGRFAEPIVFHADDTGTWCSAMLPSGRECIGAKVTMSMAESEGWTRNKKWQTMPELMLRYRAAAFFARQFVPDLLLGLYTDEEQAGMK